MATHQQHGVGVQPTARLTHQQHGQGPHGTDALTRMGRTSTSTYRRRHANLYTSTGPVFHPARPRIWTPASRHAHAPHAPHAHTHCPSLLSDSRSRRPRLRTTARWPCPTRPAPAAAGSGPARAGPARPGRRAPGPATVCPAPGGPALPDAPGSAALAHHGERRGRWRGEVRHGAAPQGPSVPAARPRAGA
jgi:hypothetical protein